MTPQARQCSKLSMLDAVAREHGYERMAEQEENLAGQTDPRSIGLSHIELGVWATEMTDGRVLAWSMAFGRKLEGRHTWVELQDEDGYKLRGVLLDPDNRFEEEERAWRRGATAARFWLAQPPEHFIEEHDIGPRKPLGRSLMAAVDAAVERGAR